MKSKLLARLERLETKVPVGAPKLFQYGWINRLPADLEGERHVVVVKREPTGSQPGAQTSSGVSSRSGQGLRRRIPPAETSRST